LLHSSTNCGEGRERDRRMMERCTLTGVAREAVAAAAL
jgi:hypothetical protein